MYIYIYIHVYIHTYPIHIYIYVYIYTYNIWWHWSYGRCRFYCNSLPPGRCNASNSVHPEEAAISITVQQWGGVEFPDFQGDSLIFYAGPLNSSDFPGKPRTFLPVMSSLRLSMRDKLHPFRQAAQRINQPAHTSRYTVSCQPWLITHIESI